MQASTEQFYAKSHPSGQAVSQLLTRSHSTWRGFGVRSAGDGFGPIPAAAGDDLSRPRGAGTLSGAGRDGHAPGGGNVPLPAASPTSGAASLPFGGSHRN